MIGADLNVTFSAKHVGDYIRTVKHPHINFSPMTYTGITGNAFEKRKFDDFEMKPKQSK